MTGFKRGRKALNKKQWNIRLLPEHSELLENPSVLKAWWRRQNVRLVSGNEKHGKSPNTPNPSQMLERFLHDNITWLCDTHPEFVLEYAETRPVHQRWFGRALNNATVDDINSVLKRTE